MCYFSNTIQKKLKNDKEFFNIISNADDYLSSSVKRKINFFDRKPITVTGFIIC